MILGFSTQINGKPTLFVEKILLGIDKHLGIHHTEPFLKEYKFKTDCPININSKIHTIREDPKDRWKKGNKIDFFINVRKKNMFQFAPVLPVVSTQKIEIQWHSQNIVNPDLCKKATIVIDGRYLHTSEIKQLAQNDGFDNTGDFFEYFNKDFTGKIIHWTDLKY